MTGDVEAKIALLFAARSQAGRSGLTDWNQAIFAVLLGGVEKCCTIYQVVYQGREDWSVSLWDNDHVRTSGLFHGKSFESTVKFLTKMGVTDAW